MQRDSENPWKYEKLFEKEVGERAGCILIKRATSSQHGGEEKKKRFRTMKTLSRLET